MGRRQRAKERIAAPTTEYTDADGNTLVLRGALTPASRQEYAAVRGGDRSAPAAAREDDWHRAAEFLFERLAVSWTVADLPITRQKELLARYRMASSPERDWIRTVLREHCAATFPDLESP